MLIGPYAAGLQDQYITSIDHAQPMYGVEIQANALAGTIYISRDVADALEGRIRTTSLGASIRLKGKSESFEILTLDGLAEDRS